MEYLIDTHILLWWLTEPTKIKPKARQVIADKTNVIFTSSVSFWEMAIKKSIGRLTLPHTLIETVLMEGFKILPILAEEALSVVDLPLLHADPFDRLLITQAKLHDLIIMTRDSQIAEYSVVTLIS